MFPTITWMDIKEKEESDGEDFCMRIMFDFRGQKSKTMLAAAAVIFTTVHRL